MIVLVLDDDRPVARGVTRLLVTFPGVVSHAAGTLVEGRALVIDLQPDVVVVDLGMLRGEVGAGAPFLEWLQSAGRPGGRVVLSSGGARPAAFVTDPSHVWLPKPYGRPKLAAAIGLPT